MRIFSTQSSSVVAHLEYVLDITRKDTTSIAIEFNSLLDNLMKNYQERFPSNAFIWEDSIACYKIYFCCIFYFQFFRWSVLKLDNSYQSGFFVHRNFKDRRSYLIHWTWYEITMLRCRVENSRHISMTRNGNGQRDETRV